MEQKRILFFIVITLSLILSGCSPKTVPDNTPTRAPANTASVLPASTRTPEIAAQNIVDLIEQGAITFELTSGAINELTLDIQNTTGQPLQVDIPAGTYFVNSDPETQNMVILHQASTSVPSNGKANIQLDAACANLHLDEPTQEDTFTIQRTAESPLLTMLIDKINSAEVDYPVEQAAVWIVSDNATFDELGMLVAGSRFGKPVINENDAARAMMLVDETVLPIRQYAIWGDRALLIGKVTAPEFSAWLDNQLATQAVDDATQAAQNATQEAQIATEIAQTGTPTAQANPTSNPGRNSQYATQATASSQYSSPQWSAMQAAEAPNTTTCGDNPTAWASASSTGKDWLLLTYEQAVIPTRIVIHETYNPGAVSKVEVLDEDGKATTVYEATPTIVSQCPNLLEIDIKDVSVPVREVRVSIDQSRHNGWAEIDAVELISASFPFALTVEKYHETDDIESACSLELGPTWRTADWNDILAYSQSGNSIQSMASDLTLTETTPYWVTYNGQRWYSGQRHYFVELHNHILPNGWLSHADIDDHFIDLGSWYGLQAEILCTNK